MAWTREQQNAAWREWYERNRAKKLTWQRRRRYELRDWLRSVKAERGCESCGGRNPDCLQFHHRDGEEKEFNVSEGGDGSWSKARVLAEIAKCIVLCGNCHAKRHWADRLEKAKAKC